MKRSIVRTLAALSVAAGLTAGSTASFAATTETEIDASRPVYEQVDSIPMLTRPYSWQAVDDETVVRVAGTEVAHIADIVGQQRQHEMQPVRRLDAPAEQAAAQDGLADQRHQCGVVGVVIEGVAVGDALDHQLPGAVEDAAEFRLLAAIDALVGLGEMTAERVCQQCRLVEHARLPPHARRDRGGRHASSGRGRRQQPRRFRGVDAHAIIAP